MEKGFKIAGWVCMILALLFCGLHIRGCVNIHFAYEREIGNYWELSDRSSTLEAKSKYMDQFIKALEKSEHTKYDAVIYPTPQNNFDNNLLAVKTLRDRLNTIKAIDEKSFAYQTAIQQITAQEQGEAKQMIDIFEGCYDLANYWPGWSWFAFLVICGYCVLFIFGLAFAHADEF